MESPRLALFIGIVSILGCGSSGRATKSSGAGGNAAVRQSAAALSGVSCSGSNDLLSAPSLAGFGQTVAGTCSGAAGATLLSASTGEAEQALTTLGTQQIAPMVRPLSAASVCATKAGSPSTAASVAVALDALIFVSHVEDSSGGGAAGCSMAYSNGDALRLLFAGVHPDGHTDCNSPERQALANAWQSLFDSTCGSACAGGGLVHLFRPSDLSDTTEALLAALHLPPASQNPFCNGWGSASSVGKAGGADFLDNDPIRRPCSATDGVCRADGTLGLVLPLVVPQASSSSSGWAQPAGLVYPKAPCTGFALASHPVSMACPDGSAPINGTQCWLPSYVDAEGINNFACDSAALTSSAPSAPPGLNNAVYNLELRARDGSIQLDDRGRPIVGAFYRLRETAGCTDPSSDGQLACLSTHTACSLGLRSLSAASQACHPNSCSTSPVVCTWPSTVVKLGGVTADTQTIQNRVTAPAQAYPLAHKVYVNTVVGWNNLAGAADRLGVCWTRPSLARSAALQNGFVDLPQGPICEDFDETACGASSNADACALSSACPVDPSKELLITDLSVVEDPIRTAFRSQDDGDPRQGAFTVKHLFDNFSPTVADAPDHLQSVLLDFFARDVDMQTFSSSAEPMTTAFFPSIAGSSFLPRDPLTGKLDLTQAPFRLLAIAARVDLRDLAQHSAGEGRFIFGFSVPSPSAQDPSAQDPSAQDPSAQDPSAQDRRRRRTPSHSILNIRCPPRPQGTCFPGPKAFMHSARWRGRRSNTTARFRR